MDVGMPMFYANASGKGYYRTAYTPTQYKAIVAKALDDLRSNRSG